MKHKKIQCEKDKDHTMNLDYLLYLPENYDSKEQWPLILFLHGAGEIGDDLEQVKEQGLPKKLEEGEAMPFIVISPQCPSHTHWGMHFDALYELIQEIKKEYAVNHNKVYLTGLSMGGYGTWAMALKYLNEFAALVPICGGLRNHDHVTDLKNIPIWAFHGLQDHVVPISETQKIVDKLQACDGNIKFTIYPDKRHDSWTETYNNKDVYAWLLKQERKPSKI